MALASGIEAASATEPGPAEDGATALIPAVAAGGVGLALGLVVGGTLVGRRRDDAAR